MILETRNNVVKKTDIGEAKRLVIDEEGMKFAYKAFLQYSDPISSLVRECVSNSIDSHVEANITDKNVVVKMVADNKIIGSYGAIHFIDYGVGISPDRIQNIYIKIFSSTKRESNKYIGQKGLGRLSPLGYVDMITVKTRFDGIEYLYLLHKGEVSPELEKIDECETTECNGTEIIVPIKNRDDFNAFKEAINTQLRYFDGIDYINCGFQEKTVYQGKHFLFREDVNNIDNTHVSFGRVYYPINFSVLGLSSYNYQCPIGLRFEIGELDVVWNRESLEYTDRTVKAIKAKLNLVIDEFKSMQAKQLKHIDNIEKFLTYENTGVLLDGKVKIPYIQHFLVVKRIYPKYNVADFEIPNNIFREYERYSYINNGKTSQKKLRWNKSVGVDELTKSSSYLLEGSITPMVNNYLYEELGLNSVLLIKKDKLQDEDIIISWYQKGTNKPDIKLVNQFRKEVDDYVQSKLKKYDDIVVTEDWIKERRKKRKGLGLKPKVRLDGTISIKNIECYRDYRSNNYEFAIKSQKLADWQSFTGFIIYGFSDDSNDLLKIGEILMNNKFYRDGETAYSNSTYKFMSKKLQVVKIAKDNEQYVKLVKNSIYIKDFMNGDGGTIVKRFATAKYLKDKFDKWHNPDYLESINLLKTKLPEFVELYSNLLKYSSDYYDSNFCNDGTFELAIVKHVFDEGLFDKQVLEDLRKLEAYLEKYSMLLVLDNDRVDDFLPVIDSYINKQGIINPELEFRLKKKQLKLELV